MGKFDSYEIDLRGMNADTCGYAFLLDDQFFAEIDGPEVREGKVQVELNVRKTSHAFELNFQLDGVVWVPCDRCLDDVELPLSTTDKLTVKLGSGYAEEGDSLIVIPEEEGVINVAWYMYEIIALAIPMKHVHAPGECNEEMSSKLNKYLRTTPEEDQETGEEEDEEDSEEGADKAIDPRWSELRKILDNN